MIVYRTTDRIKLKIDKLEVVIAPLSRSVKSKIQTLAMKGDEHAFQAAEEAIKHGVKSIKGLKDINSNEVTMDLDESGTLTDDSLDVIFNLPVSQKLSSVCLTLLQGIPDKFLDPMTGEPMAGVSFIKKAGKGKK